MTPKRLITAVFALAAISATTAIAPTGASASSHMFNPRGPLSFTLTSGPGTLEASDGERIACRSDLGSGRITGLQTFLALIIIHGCVGHTSGGSECGAHSPGQPEGLIHIQINGELGTIKGGTGVGALITTDLGSSFFTIEGSCLITAGTSGTLAGEITPVGTSQTTGKLIVTGSASKSGITEITVLGTVTKPKLTSFGGLIEASLSTTDENTFDGPVLVT
jgi:hypothetical protein